MKAWIALVDWIDGEVEDTDEILVYASTRADAVKKARALWSETKGAEWPHCQIEKVDCYPPSRLPRVV